MNKFYKIKFDPNKSYTIKLCSLEKRYIYYRDNFKRVCIEYQELKKQLECEIDARDMLVSLISNLKEENEKLKEKLHEKNERIIEINKIIGRAGE